ncbi:MAG: hypothetical protein KAV40_01330 [Thermoplasmatales archaeon]|nr:hypothetical protein [Thermoplasmatales archaeon]
MEKGKIHTNIGALSLTFGVVGLITYLLIGLIFSLPLGVLAVILGYKGRKVDTYAKYGFILGVITSILGIVVFIAATVYVWISMSM